MRRAINQTVVSTLITAVLLFVPAGTLAWPQAWIAIALLDICGLALGAWLARRDPALLAERMKAPTARDQAPRDRAIMIAILVVFAVWLIVAALDAKRFGWSHVPVWLQAAGAVLIVAAYGGWVGVLRENSFAATRIKLQAERNQRVISTGPYAIVRHPMYSWVFPFMIGISLLLGSWGGLVSLVAVLPPLAARILGEERCRAIATTPRRCASASYPACGEKQRGGHSSTSRPRLFDHGQPP